jgi:drug/metabolite transporter (DMT)-like permease
MNLAAVYILISVGIGALGHILLKKGMNDMGPVTLSLPWNQLGGVLWQIATNPYVFIGLTIYLGSTVFWLTALSRVDLSYAYPFASLSYGIMLIASWILFSESITPLRLLGTFIVCIGVLVISRG